jgi:hypothetical protein
MFLVREEILKNANEIDTTHIHYYLNKTEKYGLSPMSVTGDIKIGILNL